jgi:uncharacterized protein (DUF1810 family)
MEASMNDRYDLDRFVEIQAEVYTEVLRELRAGQKTGHWMWFIFPQIAGLGRSPMAERFAISSLEEARAYLDHPVLGKRLRECTQAVMDVEGKTAHAIFGFPDEMKFRSCMTLFARAATDDEIFGEVLEKYFSGESDRLTVEKLKGH